MPATQTDRLRGLTTSVAVKGPVLVKSTGSDISLSSSQVIDGIHCSSGDRVLVADQSTSRYNGIYIVSASGAWQRAADFDGSRDCVRGTLMWVTTGTTWGNTWWQVTSTGNNIPEEDPITFGLAVSPSSAITIIYPSSASTSTIFLSTYWEIVVQTTDSTTARLALESPYDRDIDMGTPQNSAIAYRGVIGRAHTWQTSDVHRASAGTASSAGAATQTFSVRKNGTTVASIVFTAAESTGSISFTSGDVSWNAGDIVHIVAPAAIQSTTLANISAVFVSIA